MKKDGKRETKRIKEAQAQIETAKKDLDAEKAKKKLQ